MQRVGVGVLTIAVALGAALGAGVVFFMALLTGWWWLAGLLAAAVVAVPGALVVGVVALRGRPWEPAARTVGVFAAAAGVVFTVLGTIARYVAF